MISSTDLIFAGIFGSVDVGAPSGVPIPVQIDADAMLTRFAVVTLPIIEIRIYAL